MRGTGKKRTGAIEPDGAKRILYWAPTRARCRAFSADLRRFRQTSTAGGGVAAPLEVDPEAFCVVTSHEVDDVCRQLNREYFALVLLDLRWSPGLRPPLEEILTKSKHLLDVLDGTPDLDLRYGFHRILVLVSDRDPERIDRFLVELGPRGVGGVIRQRGKERSDGRANARGCAFAGRVLQEAHRLIASRAWGPRALCVGGGGITGIHFELGALKCLDDCLSGNAINSFDMYFGISAGAVVAGMLGVGFSVDECMAAVAGVKGGRVPPLDLGLLKLKHLNTGGLVRRFSRGLASGWRTVQHRLSGRAESSRDWPDFQYCDLVGPPFQSSGYENMLRDILSVPGATNDFRRLPRPLFIGATDLDTRSHTLFGIGENEGVPISKAIQASLSIHPIFEPARIGDRYYSDGVITRTSNFSEAIHRGAKLIVILDPFVPYVSKRPGFARHRGLYFNIDQDLRAASYIRFENTRNWIMRAHPEVSSYAFLPANSIRRRIAVNAMDHRNYLEIWRSAYLSTLQRLEVILHRFRGDLRPFGVAVHLETARNVADQLGRRGAITFADFFPGREVVLCRPPLCLEEASVE